MQPKLRVVLLYSSSHVGSAIIFNRLLDSPDIEIVGLVRSPAVKGDRRALGRHLQKLGWTFSWLLIWQRAVQGLAYGLSLPLAPFFHRRLSLPGWYRSWQKGIPAIYASDVNATPIEAFIRGCGPDLLVSACFNRILKANIIALPKKGVLNIHPGDLPSYKGVMSYFWALKNNETRAGVTLHWINAGIDTGDIVFRKSFIIHQNTTQHQALVRAAAIGGRMVLIAAKRIRQGVSLPSLKQEEGAGSYYSMPRESDFDAYFAGRRFFRLRDVLVYPWRGLRRFFRGG